MPNDILATKLSIIAEDFREQGKQIPFDRCIEEINEIYAEPPPEVEALIVRLRNPDLKTAFDDMMQAADVIENLL
jgi:hypothetical protein